MVKYEISQKRINYNIKFALFSAMFYLIISIVIIMFSLIYKQPLFIGVALIYSLMTILFTIEFRYQSLKDIILNIDELIDKKQELDEEFSLDNES